MAKKLMTIFKAGVIFLVLLFPCLVFAVDTSFNETGVITSKRWKSGVPLGGIGCGKIELLTDGGFGNFTINHNWDRQRGFAKGAFFAVYTDDNGKKTAKMLRAGSHQYDNAPAIATTKYLGNFPTAHIDFEDDELPIDLALDAFSPLIPHNIKDSSMPVAVFTFTVTNRSKNNIDAAVLFSMENLLGWGGDTKEKWFSREGNTQEIFDGTGFSGVLFSTSQSYETKRQNTVGQYLIAVEKQPGSQISYCQNWDMAGDTVSFWDKFAQAGIIENTHDDTSYPTGAVSAKIKLKPGEERKLNFIFVWYMPNYITAYTEKNSFGDFAISTKNIDSALDKNPATRWTNNHPKKPGEAFSFGLGSKTKITKVVIDSSGSPGDLPQGYILEVSDDGDSWKKIKETNEKEALEEQTAGKLTITFDPIETRYIKITQTGKSELYFWSIHEIYVYNEEGRISFTPEDAKAYFPKISEKTIVTNNGHFYMNYFDGPGPIAEYVFKERQQLLSKTKEWQDLVFGSNLPQWLKLKLTNGAFPMFTNTLLTKDGRYALLESPRDMWGSLGTMDQRMASHAFLMQLFPELDKNEMESFAKCQQANGAITHLNGNAGEVIGDPNVFYGITDWPDLSCSWIMQVLKIYRWTGDRDFLNRMYPRIKNALIFLKNTDLDNDFIPEGGSTYDYETVPRGSFIYTASCYLGALKSAMEAARVMNDAATLKTCEEDFKRTQESVIKNMWEGSYFIKWYNPQTGDKNTNSFVAEFAGDWLSRLCGTGRTMPANKTKTAVRYLLDTHLKPFFPVPPMEVTPEGKAVSTDIYLLQDEPYLGMEAIYEGFVDEGLDVIYRVYYVGWIKNKSPWEQTLSYRFDGTYGARLWWYMTNPTTWHVFNALSGTTLDINKGMLYVHPRLSSQMKELHIPIFFPNFWCWLDYVPASKKFTLTILKVFTDKQMIISKIVPDEDKPPVKLKNSFEVKKDAVIDLSGYWNWKK